MRAQAQRWPEVLPAVGRRMSGPDPEPCVLCGRRPSVSYSGIRFCFVDANAEAATSPTPASEAPPLPPDIHRAVVDALATALVAEVQAAKDTP